MRYTYRLMQSILCLTLLASCLQAQDKPKSKARRARLEREQKQKEGQLQQQPTGGFAEEARKLKEQEEQKQGIYNDKQEESLRGLLNEYNKAKTAKQKVKIGTYLMPIASRYVESINKRNVLQSLWKDKDEQQLVGELALVLADLQQHMKKTSEGIFQKVQRNIKEFADELGVAL